MPSRLFDTLTDEMDSLLSRILNRSEGPLQCLACTAEVPVGALYTLQSGDIPIMDDVKGIYCGACTEANQKARVAHAEVAMIYARNQLKCIQEELRTVRRAARRETAREEAKRQAYTYDQHGAFVGPLVVLDIKPGDLNANELDQVMRASWFVVKGPDESPIMVQASEVTMTRTKPESVGIDVAKGVVRLDSAIKRHSEADGFYTR